MKFPRNSRLLRSSFDMAPFAAVLFLLVMFLMLGALMPVPGVNLSLQLPVADNLPGTGQPTVAVAVDANGRFYFANQIVAEDKLKSALKTAAKKNRGIFSQTNGPRARKVARRFVHSNRPSGQ